MRKFFTGERPSVRQAKRPLSEQVLRGRPGKGEGDVRGKLTVLKGDQISKQK